MKVYSSLPDQVMEGWASSNQTHPANQKIEFHYHDVEEWLEVLRGDIMFFTLSGEPKLPPLTAGSVLRIPRGEAHRADIGAGGVEYRMHLPIEMSSGFANRLSPDEIEMLQTNLDFPIREDNKDGGAAAVLCQDRSPYAQPVGSCGVGRVWDGVGPAIIAIRGCRISDAGFREP